MVMAVFAYIYLQSFISNHNFSVDAILDQVSVVSCFHMLLSSLVILTITYTFVHPDPKKPNLRGAEILIPATWGDDR
jgi:hypothetical protein